MSVQLVCGQLDRGLADLVGAAGLLLEQSDPQLRKVPAQLACQQIAGETTADDGDVELVHAFLSAPSRVIVSRRSPS